jgi:hypothetical protein
MIIKGDTMKTKQRIKIGVVFLIIAAFLSVSLNGCFGRFELTRKIYSFNQRIDNDRWIQWLAFLGMCIIPVYGLGLALDVLFGNSVEFWTGRNPITSDAQTSKIAYGSNGEILRATRLDKDRFNLDVIDKNSKYYSVLMVHENDEVSAYTPQGSLIARISHINGTPELSFP